VWGAWPEVSVRSVWMERAAVLVVMIIMAVIVVTGIWLDREQVVVTKPSLEDRVRVLEEKIEAYDQAMESQVRINQYMLDFQEQMVETRVLGLKRSE
jgi:hypothetical protein